jgi:hypothetical protein
MLWVCFIGFESLLRLIRTLFLRILAAGFASWITDQHQSVQELHERHTSMVHCKAFACTRAMIGICYLNLCCIWGKTPLPLRSNVLFARALRHP